MSSTVTADPAGRHDLDSLAQIAAVSPRHLARLFRAELGTTPTKFVEQVRLDTAVTLLLQGEPVSRTAERVGFGNPETMRRLFITQWGVPPSEYRRRFASARRADSVPS